MNDQANELRQLVSQNRLTPGRGAGGAKLLVVAGGKGGVGTTTVAVHLAAALAHRGFRPVLIDADVDGGNMAMLCGIQERYTIADVLVGRKTAQETLELGPAGVRVLAGAWELAALAEGSAVAQQRLLGHLHGLRHCTEVIVVDTGNSWSRWARGFWQNADTVLLVTTSELTAIMDTYASVKVLAAGETGGPLELVVNMAADASTAEDVESRLARACQRFLGIRLGIAGYLPYDPQTRREVREPEVRWRMFSSGFPAKSLQDLTDTVILRAGLMPVRQLAAVG